MKVKLAPLRLAGANFWPKQGHWLDCSGDEEVHVLGRVTGLAWHGHLGDRIWVTELGPTSQS